MQSHLVLRKYPQIDRIISERYQQKNEDVKAWLELTEWSQKNIDPETARQAVLDH